MTTGVLTALFLVYVLALWLGLYLVGREPGSFRLLFTGLGLITYALAIAAELLGSFASQEFSLLLARIRLPLLLLPPLLWTGTLIYLLPEEVTYRGVLARAWAGVLLFAGVFMVGGVVGGADVEAGGALWWVLGGLVLLPMVALGGLLWWSARGRRVEDIIGVMGVFTLFFALSTVLILLPFEWLPPAWVLLSVGADVIVLGLTIAYLDAFDLGEALLPDMMRSLDAALLAALVFGGQVTIVIWAATGLTLPMVSLLLATVSTAVAGTTLADRIGAALDWLALRRSPRLRHDRSGLRETVRSLSRRDPALDPTALDKEEFARLTRRALSNFGNLPRLAASPLANLPLVERRLDERGAPDDPLERASELKAVLKESIYRLKPQGDADFGTSDEWRHYNALYFPYIAGVRPYSNRARTYHKDPAARAALKWFRDFVPERTLYNWQTAAARLVAQDLRSRNGTPGD